MLKVTEIQRFCMHDGPGIRTTVFLKGCPLKCKWCHNPETKKTQSELLFYSNRCIFCKSCELSCAYMVHTVNEEHLLERSRCVICNDCANNCPTGAIEICGKEMSIEDILSVVKKDLAFYGDNGGITLSGGEPFMQGDAVIDLLKICKELGISTAVETCGYCDIGILKSAIPFVDLFLWDIKDTDIKRHKYYTGVSNKRILENLSYVSKSGAKIQLRCILINGINTEKEHYEKIADIAGTISNLDGVKLIPYHAYGGTKSILLGENDNGKMEWIPDTSQVELAKQIINSKGIKTL